MNILSWNCRGVGLPWTIQSISEVVRQETPMIILLCEPIAKKSKMKWVQIKLGYQGIFVVEPIGRNGGLALLWKEMEEVELLGFS